MSHKQRRAAAGNQGASYIPNAVYFDGTNDWLQENALTVTDGEQVALAFWFKPDADADGTTLQIWSVRGTGGAIYASVARQGSNILTFRFEDSSSATLVDADSVDTFTGGQWYHILFSFDKNNTSNRHFYVNGVSKSVTWVTYNASGNIDFEQDRNSIGSRADNNTNLMKGAMSDFFMWLGTYIDFSDAGNRAKFIDGSGNPVDPDASGGIIDTFGNPEIRLTNPAATWHVNEGTAGGFTENGDLQEIAGPAHPSSPVVTTLTYKGYVVAFDAATQITLPSDIIDGDLGIIYSSADNVSAGLVPSGWTALATVDNVTYNYTYICYKILSASDANTTITVSNATGKPAHLFTYFRGNIPITSLTYLSTNAAYSTWASQTLDGASENSPCIIFGGTTGRVDANPAFTTNSPAFATTIDQDSGVDAGSVLWGHTVYNVGTPPVDHTFFATTGGSRPSACWGVLLPR